MRSTTIVSVFLTALISPVFAQNISTGTLGNASVVENNPPGVTYVATLPSKSFFNPQDPRGNIKGSISATAKPNGIGVKFSVSFSNLPTSGGPFLYHLHDAPVPSDGNCTKTLAHLDPYIRGEVTPCDSKLPQTCQVGDLSGKNGNIQIDPFVASYSDDFAATVKGLGSYFGNRSIAIHFSNKTRITCANFTLATLTGSNGTGNGTTTPTGSPAQYTGAVAKNVVSVGAVAGAFAAALLL